MSASTASSRPMRRSRCSGCSVSTGSSPATASRRGSTCRRTGRSAANLRFEGKLAAGPIDVGGKGTLRLATRSAGDARFRPVRRHDRRQQGAGPLGASLRRCAADRRIDRGGIARRAGGDRGRDRSAGASAARAGPAGPPSRSPGARPASTAASPSRRSARCSRRGWWRNGCSGVARFNGPEVVFEDVAGEIGKGRFDGRLAVSNGAAGLTARLRVGARRRRARRDLRQRRSPGDVRPSDVAGRDRRRRPQPRGVHRLADRLRHRHARTGQAGRASIRMCSAPSPALSSSAFRPTAIACANSSPARSTMPACRCRRRRRRSASAPGRRACATS